MSVPIVIAAFGTTSKARTLYQQVDAYLKVRFPDDDIHWAFTSRMIRNLLKHRNVTVDSPREVVGNLAAKGHRWAVVQSFNMICGHEFYRLVEETRHESCRVSIGHSLLCSQRDHEMVAQAMAPIIAQDEQEALLLVGHGTDHCSWTTYPAFYQRLEEIYGERVFGGMIEDGYPNRDHLIKKIKAAGFTRIRLMPFMLVAGVHFEEDLADPEDSWKAACEAQGLTVSLESEGLGARPAVIDIFCDHIQSALDVIPDTAYDGQQDFNHRHDYKTGALAWQKEAN